MSLEAVEKLAIQASPTGIHGATSQIKGVRDEVIMLFTTETSLIRDALLESAKLLGLPESLLLEDSVYRQLAAVGCSENDYVSLKRMAEALV